MMIAQELKNTVENLPPDELLEFSEWFEEFMADQWDKKIETDILAGRLDTVGKIADNEFITGRAKPL
ncbi:MAG: hypothetical protein ACOYNF_13760 [Rhodoferax sp.]